MRVLATILIGSGLATLSGSGVAQQAPVLTVSGIALAGLWGLAIALRWPRGAHTACLGATTSLCALSVVLQTPILIPLFCLSASLYGWDLALLDLRLQAHPAEATSRLFRTYAARCFVLALIGSAATFIAHSISIRLSFATAFGVLCLCVFLILFIHRHAQRLVGREPLQEEESGQRLPPASRRQID